MSAAARICRTGLVFGYGAHGDAGLLRQFSLRELHFDPPGTDLLADTLHAKPLSQAPRKQKLLLTASGQPAIV